MSKGRVTQQKKGGGKSQSKKERPGAGALRFARDVRSELKKVSWPDREQLRQSTAVVLVIVVTIGVYVAAWDFIFRNLTRFIFF
jgi:preprotein translocase subunit SecE